MMEAREYESYQVIGVSNNVTIATLAHKDWVVFVNGQLNKDNMEWYSTPTMKQVHNLTGRGYFPRGITLGDATSSLIVIDGSYANDEKLIAHEYGHALGYGHTHAPTTMNPVSNMRLYDAEKLVPKFRADFPELAQSIKQTKPLQIPTPLLTAGLLFFFLRG
jgi:hypothetical protein